LIEGLKLEDIDVDGAIREGAEEIAGDTRVDFLRRAGIAGGAALSGGAILGAIASPALAASSRPPVNPFGTGDVGILRFALTLEYLEAAFYNEATAKGAVRSPQLKTFLKTVTKDENDHVAFLKKALGKSAIKKPKFNFHGTTGNETKFAQTAFAPENTGVHAYLGQAGNIKAAKYLLAAASIVTIEARHSGAIGLILGKGIAPSGPFDTGLPASAILKAVKKTKFIVG
jgi:Ferritin-like domain